MLPLLAQLRPPLALLEVGASAGLCLLPDHYGYDYGNARLDPTVPGDAGAPVFPCNVSGAVPIPKSIPRIAWRAGLDLHPLDVRSDHDMAWLETLVWPGQNERAARLHAAINVAARSAEGGWRRFTDRFGTAGGSGTGGCYAGRLSYRRAGLCSATISAGAVCRSREANRSRMDQQRSSGRLSIHRRTGAAFARKGAFSPCAEWHAGRVDRAARTVTRLVRPDMMVATKCRRACVRRVRGFP